jgi:hypothetical protein
MTQIRSLADALPVEIKRCQELLTEYQSLGAVGIFGATMIKQNIEAAVEALSRGDVVEQIRCYNELKECK